jgi:hypothetical protein
MKNIYEKLFGLNLLLVLTFSACKKESLSNLNCADGKNNSNNKNPNLIISEKNLFENDLTAHLLSNYHLQYVDENIEISQLEKGYIYSKKLKGSSSADSSEYHFFIASTSSNRANMLFLSKFEKLNEKKKKMTIYNAFENSVIGSLIFNVNVNGNLELDTVTTSLPCTETTTSFLSCVSCAWQDLNSDFIGSVTCSINPGYCLIACGLTCALFGPLSPFQGENVDYASIESAVTFQISNGFYNNYSDATTDSKLKFMYIH